LLDEKNLAIIRCIINMARALGLAVVSGGADSAEHISALHRSGCHVFQGTLTGQRMTLLELLTWKSQLPALAALRNTLADTPPTA